MEPISKGTHIRDTMLSFSYPEEEGDVIFNEAQWYDSIKGSHNEEEKHITTEKERVNVAHISPPNVIFENSSSKLYDKKKKKKSTHRTERPSLSESFCTSFLCESIETAEQMKNNATYSPKKTSLNQNGKLLSINSYFLEILLHSFDSTSLRRREAQLSLWEIVEHFNFINDFLLILRMSYITHQQEYKTQPALQRIGNICYATRRYFVYHRITPLYSDIFYPLHVLRRIRQLGDISPETLYMFERLSLTYQILMRFLDDIPQVVISTFFLFHFGRNFYTYFVVVYSCGLTLITSIRMSFAYPLWGTLSLIFSRSPPVDSPVLYEAAPITRNFSLFLSANMALWSLANLFCYYYIPGVSLFLFSLLSFGLASASLALLFFWCYFAVQSDKIITFPEYTRDYSLGIELLSPLPHLIE
ncbi:uncharacterized protein LOC128883554 isoform X2 [Hylaeus volcanicus]|uniref:uncharacterized protein LOC128883554 isoform X2 n=1 Tax=Hylaeus volcanicus TaxID=313075 RepID=UPI0023B8021E|nr:uncharacterized protein LOC128883554 isoform X2 [Hylaeus volcanicus]